MYTRLIIQYNNLKIPGEAVTGFQNGKWAHKGNAQHISMFMFFGIIFFL